MKRFEVIADKGENKNVLIHASNTDDRVREAVLWAAVNGYYNVRVNDLLKLDKVDINKMFVRSIT